MTRGSSGASAPPDVEDVAVLLEPARDRRGQHLQPAVGVVVLLVVLPEGLDQTGEVGRARGLVDADDLEPARPDGDDLVAAVLGLGDLPQQRHAAHLVQRLDVALADLVAGLDGHDAEAAQGVVVLPGGHQVLHQQAVAGLEHVEGQHETGEEDAAQGEQREALRHAPTLRARPGRAAAHAGASRPP